MSTRIVIAGAGGFGRGVYGWLAHSPQHRDEYDVADVVFIADDEHPVVAPQAPIISTIRDFVPEAGDAVLCAIGSPQIRKRIVSQLSERGAVIHTFVDDRAVIGSRVKVGEGAIVCPGVVVSADVVIGEQVHINFNCSVGHDTVLGPFTTLSPSVNVMGEVAVGEEVFFGGSATALPRITIAARTVVGAGAVVVGDVGAGGVTLVGNPARVRERRTA